MCRNSWGMWDLWDMKFVSCFITWLVLLNQHLETKEDQTVHANKTALLKEMQASGAEDMTDQQSICTFIQTSLCHFLAKMSFGMQGNKISSWWQQVGYQYGSSSIQDKAIIYTLFIMQSCSYFICWGGLCYWKCSSLCPHYTPNITLYNSKIKKWDEIEHTW